MVVLVAVDSMALAVLELTEMVALEFLVKDLPVVEDM